MIRHRELTSQKTKNEVTTLLNQQVYKVFPFGFVEEDKFCIYKTSNDKYQRTKFVFKLSGTISESDQGIVMKYLIQPTLTSILIATILFIAFIIGVISFINGANNDVFLIIALAANILLHLSIILQEQTYIKQFESKLI